jgi:hypothetical protein
MTDVERRAAITQASIDTAEIARLHDKVRAMAAEVRRLRAINERGGHAEGCGLGRGEKSCDCGEGR